MCERDLQCSRTRRQSFKSNCSRPTKIAERRRQKKLISSRRFAFALRLVAALTTRVYYACRSNTVKSVHLSISPKPSRPTQPPTLSGTGNEYHSQSAVMLCGWGVKAGMVHCTCGWTCGWQVKLCDPSLTRAIHERFRDESL